jgi:hypothetical protein
MTGPIPHEDQADDDVQGWMSEAGAPLAAPRPEHVERLRGMILDRLPPARPARAKSRRLRWLAAAAVLAATALGLLSLPGRQTNAWAQVVRAMQEKPWVHVVTRHPDRFKDEGWINPRNEVVAFTYDHGPTESAVEFHDLKTDVYFKYIPGEKTIYRLPEPGGQRKRTSEYVAFMKRLLQGEIAIDPIPAAETTGPTVRTVVEDGKSWIAYEWRHKLPGRVQDSLAKTRILVDPATKLPRFWDVESVEGTSRRREFDYPESGPADILAMGVPADAKRVDRVPGDDLDRLLKGLAAGRNRFDDYQGFAWHDGGSNAWRVFRKGRKWRVESAIEKVFDPDRRGFPPDADLAWWRAHEPDYHFELQAVCDGRTIWYYRHKPQSIGPNDPYRLEKPSSISSHEVYGSPDDPLMPWAHLLPEQIGHPQTDGPGSQRTLTVDPKPDDGPPNTVRLSVRDASLDGPNPPDLFRLWVDPDKNDLALRAESAVSSGPHGPAARWKVVHIEVNILEDLARSPGGFWYPTRVRRQTPVNEFNKVEYGDTVTRFALDFQAPLPDDLFRPLDLPGVPVE